mmetsp:Transcript_14945/g.48989  ORF Transcript_14945/g.48989 Transcript_14945/m.48989 type:complete len:224 (+) Transcript_14945:150-821(+)
MRRRLSKASAGTGAKSAGGRACSPSAAGAVVARTSGVEWKMGGTVPAPAVAVGEVGLAAVGASLTSEARLMCCVCCIWCCMCCGVWCCLWSSSATRAESFATSSTRRCAHAGGSSAVALAASRAEPGRGSAGDVRPDARCCCGMKKWFPSAPVEAGTDMSGAPVAPSLVKLVVVRRLATAAAGEMPSSAPGSKLPKLLEVGLTQRLSFELPLMADSKLVPGML